MPAPALVSRCTPCAPCVSSSVATVFWLDDLSLVERNVVYGHAIHVTEPEIELMGRRNVSVTSHPSCNFHMRNEITPVVPLRAAGVNVAMGLDDKTIND